MPPRVYDNPRPRCEQCPWLPPFLARLLKVRFLNSRAAQGGGRGRGGQMRASIEEFKQWDGRGRNDHDCVVIHR